MEMIADKKDQFISTSDHPAKITISYTTGKSYSTDISNKREILEKNTYKLSPICSPDIRTDNQFFTNQPLFQNLYNLNQMRSKFLGYKISLNEIRNKECPFSLKIIILKSIRNNLVSMIKQNKQLIKEKKRCQQITFEENLNLIGQSIKENASNFPRKSLHKKNASTVLHYNQINKPKNTHPKQSSQGTLVSNESTNDGVGEEEKFIESLKESIDGEEEKLIEIKNFKINLAIQLDDVKEDLQFEKKMLMEKMKKVEEKSLQIEQFKIKIQNMSKRKDFFKNPKKSNTMFIHKDNHLTTTMTTRDVEKSMLNVNTSRMNTSFMDDFSHGFNTVWNTLLTKFKSRSAKNNNILDSISSIEKSQK